MLKKLQYQLFLTLGFWLSAMVSGLAQTYPVTISTQISQPSPIYLSNYADATTINSPIKVQISLNDLTISNRQIRLKCYFQGQSISLTTNDFVVGARDLYLEGGVPLQLTNVDLAPYFEYQNLLGINPNQYAQALPEGIYNFSVEVYDFATNKKLSKKTSVTTIIFQNDPPFLNLPLNNASIMQQNIQNIIFSWTPRQINVSNVEYEFSLVEIWDKYTPVQNAFLYSPPLFTTTTRSTTLQYGVSEPQLLPGKKYAWRIKAKALQGAEEIGVFKNNGYSEIFSFDYETYCTAPLAINVDGISENQAKVSWSGSIDNFDYQVNYREKNADSEWYKVVTPRENLTITNLKPNTTYEYTVGASCEVGKYTLSTVKEFNTLVRDEIAFQGCGLKPDPADLANTTPLKELLPNDVIAAGDFPIVVLHATGSNGTFSGDGYVTLPFIEKFRQLIDAADTLIAQSAEDKEENEKSAKVNISENTRIRITFNSIGLNTDFKLISGEIIAAYDPNWSSMADLDGVFKDVFGSDGKPVEGKLDYVIESVTLNPDGSTTIKGTNGAVTVLPKSSYDQVYTDKDGKTVTIPAEAKDQPTVSNPAEGGKATAANTNGISSSGEVVQISSSDVKITFSNGTNAKYAFDPQPKDGPKKLLESYETIPTKTGGTYKVNYKAISDLSDAFDFIIAEAEFKNGKTLDDVVFKTNAGEEVATEKISDTKVEIKISKKFNFAKHSIIATVKGAQEKDPNDPSKTIAGKSDIAGKINLWDLTQKPSINVTILSVNGANVPSTADAEKFLNDVYNKAGIKFNVTSQNVNITTLPNIVPCGDSGIMNVYTDGQINIINQIEASNLKYDDETYYIIYTGRPGQDGYKGFMPLGGQYAFVFDNNLKTAAHELGHGIFGLKHPFSTDTESGKTDLLMDYGNGTVLSHNDWDIIHSGGWKFYGFQKSSSGALAGGFGLTPDWKLVSAGESNIVSTEAGLVAEGHLSGFRDANNVRYLWNKEKNTYTVDGKNTGDEYKGSIISTTKDNPTIWLVYNYSNNCNEIKYIRTQYKEIAELIDLKDKAEAQRRLQTYIEGIDGTDIKQNPNIYSALLGCGESGNGSGNGGVYVKNLIKGEVKKEVLDKLEALMSGKSKNWITGLAHQIKGRILLTSESEKPDRVVYKDNNFYVDNVKEEIKADEIVFWMEYNTDGKIKVKQIISGSSFDESMSVALKSWGSQLDWKQKTLFEKIIAIGYESVDGYFTAYYDLFDFLSKNIEKAKIPAEVYDCKLDKYKPIYAEVFSYINFFSAIQDQLLVKISASYPDFKELEGTPSQIQFALFCGMYNGLVDVVKSVPDLAKLLVSSFSEKGRTNNSEFIASISEKKIFSEEADGSKKLLFDKGITFPKIWYLLSETISDQFSTSQPCKTAEFVGSVIGPVIVMCFGDEVAGEGIASKIFSSTLKAINFCGKITDPFHYLGLSYNFIKPLTGKLAVIGENAAGDVIRQLKDNLFRVKLISEGEVILADIAGEELQALATKSAKGEITELIVNGSKKGVRILSNTTPIIKDFAYQTKKMVAGAALLLTMGNTTLVSAAIKQGTKTVEYTINVAGETILTDVAKVAVPKFQSIAKAELEKAATTTIKIAADAAAEEGKLAFLQGIDNLYDAIAFKIGANKIIYKLIPAFGASVKPIVYTFTENDTPQDDNKCKFCPQTYKLNSDICNKLNQLDAKTNNSYTNYINNLCSGLTSSNANSVITQLLTWNRDKIILFLKNINEGSTTSDHIAQHIQDIDINILNSWEIVAEARCSSATIENCNSQMQKDWKVLKELKTILINNQINSDLGDSTGLQEYIKTNTRSKCTVCGNSGVDFIQPMDQYLIDLAYFASHYINATGRNNVKSLLITSSDRTREAEYYILKVIKANPNIFNNITAYEYTQLEGCEPDVVNAGVYCEFKSWSNIPKNTVDKDDPESASSSNGAFSYFKTSLTGNSFKQFKALLATRQVNNMNKIAYYFDALKLAGTDNTVKATWVKEVFKEMMYKNNTLTQQGNEVFNAIWSNTELRTELFPDNDNEAGRSEALSDFTSFISNTNNSFYNFIKVL
ncbi:fibronectin type III domain-containing protein [Flavobacterium sp. SH_e]|uniref:fibronectin type III domain-containing protein n=1 Tax=Flavobacterium sp. SH_e TaxID=2983767 RepID=UPI0021E35B88|nr:fibronectin type III domain-containing protein [Flavobacterium sp. SH_e]MCV2486985.1 fibronectin type III domain-containing protein [Flavobacterium sp. SH_e]